MTHFPTVRWKREWATFVATDKPPVTDAKTPAALVFPFYGDSVVLADIVTRGWCIPSGHLEPGETAEQAMRREALEEAGATLGKVAYVGYFVLTDAESKIARHAPTFIAEVIGIGAVPDASESRGMQLVNVEDVSGMYFAWDELLSEVFAYAYERKADLLPVGIPLSTLLDSEE